MDMSPIIISMKTAALSILITFFLGVLAARWVVSMKHERWKTIIDGLFTVAGFFLLYIFGVTRPIGKFFIDFFSWRIAFSWSATVLAAVVISFPLMYRSARAAFEQVDTNVIYAARTLGISENRIFWKIIMPLARPGVAAGGVLAYARGLGEFGATAMIAGNIAGKTRTLPLAVYSKVAGNDMEGAYIYVAILIAICFIVVIGMNYFSAKESKYQQRAEK